jgi:hypothetical protein
MRVPPQDEEQVNEIFLKTRSPVQLTREIHHCDRGCPLWVTYAEPIGASDGWTLACTTDGRRWPRLHGCQCAS